MWLAIFAVVGLLGIISVIFLIRGFHRFHCLEQLAQKHRLLSWLAAMLPVALLMCTYFINVYSMFIVLIHLMVIWLICDITGIIIRKLRHKERTRNYTGGAALLLNAAVLCAGWYFAHHVYEKDYRLETEKSLGGEPLRIAMLADSHLGVTLSGQDFAAQLKRIEAAEPDVLFICGDFVDDDSRKADMLTACEALGDLHLKYGVFYVYGNHDNGYYNRRDFSPDDLRNALTENHVQILEDEVMTFDDRFAVIGRKDFYADARLSADALAKLPDDSLYQIVLDHQPTDYDAEAAAGFDLVLCGHTHGGHLFPAGLIGLVISENDAVYGLERRGNTSFIVTSGISGWAIPFKTGATSEYCIIDVSPV